MSYGFRTPQEKVLSTFSPSTMDNVASFSGRNFEEVESKLGKYFNFYLTDKKKEFASSSGIYLSPYSFISHTHPLCKTIENHFLYVVIPPLVSSLDKLNVVSMKESKLKIFHNEIQNKRISLNLINRLFDVKDSLRYHADEGVEVKYPTTLLSFFRGDYDPLLDCRIDRNSNFLFHDEMHYWNYNSMLNFLGYFEPNIVLCTVVFPIEILSGVKQSLFPDVYSFEISGGNFTFAPDGVFSEGYEQSVDMKWLFCASSFLVNDIYYSVELIKTIGAHHLFCITKGRRVVKRIRYFRGFDILDLSSFSGTMYKIPIVDVHFSFFKKVVIYLKSLKKPDTQSAVAKLRQLVGDQISLSETLFIEDFAYRFQTYGSAKLSLDGLMDLFFNSIKEALPNFARRMLPSFNKDNILKQIASAKPFEFELETFQVDRYFDNNQVFRFLKSLCQDDVITLNCDILMYPSTIGVNKDGSLDDQFDRRNLVNSYTPSFYSYPNVNRSPGEDFKTIRLGAKEEKVEEMRFRTPIILKGSKVFDSRALEKYRAWIKIKMRTFPGSFARDASTFEPFFLKPTGYKHIKAICAGPNDELSSSLIYTIDDEVKGLIESMLDDLTEPSESGGEIIIFNSSSLEPTLNSVELIEIDQDLDKQEERLNIDEVTCAEVPIEISSLVEGKDLSSFQDKELSEVSSDGLSDHFLRSSELYKHFPGNDYIERIPTPQALKPLIDDFNSYIKSIEGKRIKSRKAHYFCKDSRFSYGHDKIKYKNLGWPKEINEIAKLADSITGFKFNSAIINTYKRGGRIPWHADDEDVYDLESNPVLTIESLGSGVFYLQENDRKYTLPMKQYDMVLMKEGAQKKTKHSVLASTGRISITLREQKRSSDKITENSKSIRNEKIKIEDLKEACLIVSMAEEIRTPIDRLVDLIKEADSGMFEKIMEDKGLTLTDLEKISNLLCLRVRVLIDGLWSYFGVHDSNFRMISLMLDNRHFLPYSEKRVKLVLGEEVTSEKVDIKRNGAFFNHLLAKIDPNLKFVNKFERDIDLERASVLLGSLLRGTTGVISSSTFGCGTAPFTGRKKNVDPDCLGDPKFLKSLIGDHCLVKGALLMGFAGSGKSRPVQIALSGLETPKRILLISPRVNLLGDWKNKVDNKQIIMKTFESALRENFSSFGVIIIDEFLLVPRGFTDLIAYKAAVDCKTCGASDDFPRLLLIGDPLQAAYYNQADDGYLPLSNELQTLEIDSPKYLMYSHRLSKSMSWMMELNMMGNSNSEDSGKIYNSSAAAFSEGAFEVILVAGRQEKLFFSNFNVMTFGESQGLTFDKVSISLSDDTLLSSDNQVMVALTRAKKQFTFIKCFGYSIDEYIKRAGSKLIGKVMRRKKISEKELLMMTGVEDITPIREEITFGGEPLEVANQAGGVNGDPDGYEGRVSGDPWMKGMLTLFEEPEVQEPFQIPEDLQDIKMKVHIPITDKSYALTIINDQIRAREYREAKSNDSWSSQFKDDDKNINLETSTGAVNFEAIFPRHSSFDDVTFWMAVKKRLTFSNPLVESEKLKKAWVKGEILFKEFKSVIRLNSNFRPDLFERGLKDFERVRMSKSKKLIEAHAGRSDPDWDVRNFLLFMKSQLCKKAEKAFCDAKAGQTIACFAHGVLFKFSVWARYAELKIQEQMPENFYIHSRKNFDEMEDWVKRNFIGPICVESDYEAFDSSQDASILAFEMILLREVGWPNDLIEDYKTLKLELGCKLGSLAIMRFTGEFGTFFFNTLANMAFTLCRYNVNRRTPICFAGDDMCILTNATVRHEMDEFLGTLKLKAKVEWKINPIFCGWILSRHGVLKLPSLVYYRLCIAQEKGNLKDCIDSYMIEAGYAYRKGAFIEELLDEDQMNFHQLVIRRMVKSKNLMKGSSISILEELMENYSDGVD